ncbi:MAG TPA: BTAD domain-containing putative transcriptional regulator [Actinopolymorphaceae bacterium]
MEFAVLGALRVHDGTEEVQLTAPSLRRLLTLLLSRPSRRVALDVLVRELWEETATPRTRRRLQLQIHRLRRALGDTERIVFDGSGYVLHVHDGELDADRFQVGIEAGCAAVADGDPQRGIDTLRSALRLWRGLPYAEIEESAAVRPAVERLVECRLSGLEALYTAELASDRHAAIVPELQIVTTEWPYRERLHELLVEALHRCGRRAEALAAYHDARTLMKQGLGIEPGPGLRRLQARILAGDDGAQHAVRSGRSSSLAVPAQLPPDVGSFTGREPALAALDALLDADRAVVGVVTGPPGVGKSAVVIHWAHRVRDRFPDGQVHLDLQGYASAPPIEPREALTRLVRAFGVPPEAIPSTEEELNARYRALIRDRKVLVVLDNATGPEHVRALLPEDAESLVVVTSRHDWSEVGDVAGAEVRPVRLEPLSLAEGHALLAKLLGEGVAEAEPTATAEVVRLCGGLPLALRIAGANVASRGCPSLSGFVAELADDRLGTLAVEGDARAAVRATFDLSYGALPEDARIVFRRLGLFPGTEPSAEIAANLAEVSADAATEALQTLTTANLLEANGDGRFRMHDLLRVYARDRADVDDDPATRDAAATRVLAYYIAVVRRLTPLLWPGLPVDTEPLPVSVSALPTIEHRRTATAWLRDEHANLVAAIVALSPHPLVWRLVHVLRRHLGTIGDDAAALVAAESGLASARAEGDLTGELAMMRRVASAHFAAARYDEAIAWSEHALRLARDAGDPHTEGMVHGDLRLTYNWLGKLDRALDHAYKSLEAKRNEGYVLGVMTTLVGIGGILAEQGKLAEARRHVDQASRLASELESYDVQTSAHNLLAEIDLELGNLSSAARNIEFSLEGSEAAGNRRDSAYYRMIRGRIRTAQGDYVGARRDLEETMAAFVEMGWPRAQIEGLTALATLDRVTGRPASGLVRAESALALATETGHRTHRAHAHKELAELHLVQGDLRAAREHAREAADLYATAGQERWYAEARRLLSELVDSATARSSPMSIGAGG